MFQRPESQRPEPSQASDIDFATVLASSVHDMKNSVSMLLASLQDVLAENPPEVSPQARHFVALQYEASRINNELVQLLSIYRLQQKRLPLHVDQHFILDVIEDQLARQYPLLEGRQVKVTVQCDAGLEGFFDADLIGSVLQNVLVNGCRYTQDRLEIAAQAADGWLQFSVADNGQGFPPDMLTYPLDAGVHRRDSTQLGLYFASVIARLHQQGEREGYIALRNGAPLGGGVFSIVLPP